MNERIHELMKLSGAWDYFNSGDDKSALMDRKALENFAELIVRECAQLAMTQHTSTCPDDYNEMDPYDKGRDDVASTISGLICRTFGVK